ncbi:hypothetical protein BSKO_01285 [Bryopsis sp. KO-2023]|nr:hypothetical protein BSKO_01285 [Bryopsis sp. KO-2023]
MTGWGNIELVASLAQESGACARSPSSSVLSMSAQWSLLRSFALRLHQHQLRDGGGAFTCTRSLAKFTQEKKTKGENMKQVDEKIQKLLKMYKETKKQAVEKTPEEVKEGMAKAKEYNRKKMIQHREIQKDMSDKRRLLKSALKALPERLRGAAAEWDDTPPPSNMPFPTDTPPNAWT